MSKRFKILSSYKQRDAKLCSVPWEMVEPFQERAYSNHSQSLERLDSRGGLSIQELYLLINDKSLRSFNELTDDQAEKYVINLLNKMVE